MSLPDQRRFDVTRAVLKESAFYPPAHVTQLHSLTTLMTAGNIRADTPLLVMDTPQGTLAFLTVQLVYHHVAQGDLPQTPWVAAW
jgi:hypothetical protein